MTAVAALALGGLMTSCTKDKDLSGAEASQSITEKYEQIFVTAFGQPAPTQTWGFGENTTASTRGININDDVYDDFNLPTTTELTNAYPRSIPGGADEVKDLTSMTKYQTSTYSNGDIWWIYSVNGGSHNYQITSTGEVTIGGGWKNESNQIYNVYVSVNGNVTLKRNGTEFMNLYILSGNVTLDSNFGECGGLISVASGAILNDARDHIAHNGGIKLFNRGTVNATNSSYMIGNNAYIYNEGTFNVSGHLNYNAGSGNPPYFFNVGDDVILTADSFTLNSNGGFISDGTVEIEGLTLVTQAGIVWVNNGHYTTNTFEFSAKNGTFYNYCQLIVEDNCKFLDGEFNMMQNSYAEIKTGMFDNFIVNMHNNSGINITDGSKFERQAQGTFQGFRAVNDNAVVYVRLGGQTYVPSHNGAAFHVQGANLTLAYNSIKFYNDYNGGFGNYQSFSGPGYWNETTAEALVGDQDGRITWDLHNVTKLVTGDDFASTGFTTTEGQCAATWTGEPGGGDDPDPEVVRIIAEDLTWGSENGDFDFNDVIFDVQLIDNGSNIKITLRAAGGTLPLYIAGVEVHEKFGVSTSTMVNTYTDNNGNLIKDHQPVSFTIPNQDKKNYVLDANGNETYPPYGSTVKEVAWKLPVEVLKLLSNGSRGLVELTAPVGKAAAKVAVGNDYNNWCPERTSVDDKFFDQSRRKGKFSMYVKQEAPYAADNSWYR